MRTAPSRALFAAVATAVWARVLLYKEIQADWKEKAAGACTPSCCHEQLNHLLTL